MRLLVISNRLPITLNIKDDKLKFRQSTGGLVSGLSAYLDSLKGSSFTQFDYMWVGWPGIAVEDKLKEEAKTKTLSQFRAYPVYLSEQDMDKFYFGFCNKTIWPLFHYFPSYAIYDEAYWNNYKEVNKIFCNTLLEIVKPDDIVWVHDYHLMLLPKLLRENGINVPIGFFLHVPFPSYEIFRLLPSKWRIEILEGLLGADLIGFHIQEYTHYFLRCVLRILGHEHNMGLINLNDRIAKAETFPMGIDFIKYNEATNKQKVASEKEELKKTLVDRRVILSIDRLDYTKGIINRLRSYEIFLEKNPNWHKKVVLILILVPSRVGVEHYQEIKRQTDELTGKINGRFGDIDWTPIVYQYKFLPFVPLVALYGVSDVCLVTPLRDGMNLVAKEYLAARADKTGVLILSEMAGAAKELGEAIIINPNNIDEIATALKEALEMPPGEQIKRNSIMQSRLKRYDVVRWANDFISELKKLKKDQDERYYAKLLNPKIKEQMKMDFKKASRKIIFLDYDGTLAPFASYPHLAKPTEEILAILEKLIKEPNCEVALVSGRDRNTLQDWFGRLGLGLVAEHGVWVKEKNGNWELIKPLMSDWKLQLLPILELYADRLPGSFVEEKEFSIVWHYRRADPELGSLRAKELVDELVNFTANIDIQILQGSKVVEIRNSGVNKGVAAMHFLAKNNYDFILAIGDDFTDEDLFRAVRDDAYTVRVGIVASYAKFNVRNYLEVRWLLEEIIK